MHFLSRRHDEQSPTFAHDETIPTTHNNATSLMQFIFADEINNPITPKTNLELETECFFYFANHENTKDVT